MAEYPCRPRIGILSSSGCLRDGGWPVYAGDAATATAIGEAGGSPLIIPTMTLAHGRDPCALQTNTATCEEMGSMVWQTLASLDALVLAGGGDIHPALYGQQMHPQTGAPDCWRDLWERAFALAAWQCALPTLGICRGMQMLQVALGGALMQDVTSVWPQFMPPLLLHRVPGRIRAGRWARHTVSVKAHSQLAAILRDPFPPRSEQPQREEVLSMHHQIVGYVTPEGQVVGDLAPGLSVNATAPDGVIEGIEASDPRRFWLGVQFHPEWTRTAWARRLFRALVAAARPFQPTRPEPQASPAEPPMEGRYASAFT